MSLVSNPKDGDEVSVRQAIARLGSSKLGPTSTPTFADITTTTLTISGLTTDSLIYPNSGLLTSLGVAANGQLPIGSTGTTPVLATLTGTAKRISVTNAAGSITLSGPQDLDTVDSPTFAGATITNCAVFGLNSAVFQPNADSTTFFQIKDKDGNGIGVFDTINNRFGIGTNAPSCILHVESTAANTIPLFKGRAAGGATFMEFSNSNGHGGIRMKYDEGTFVFEVAPGQASFSEVLYLGSGSAGNGVGIGKPTFIDAAPVRQLDVRGSPVNIRLLNTAASDEWWDVGVANSPLFAFQINNDDGVALTISDTSLFVGLTETEPETLLELTHATPYITFHNDTHEDSDGGGESRIIGKREDGAGTESTAGQIEISHDGTGVNNTEGKIVLATNNGAGLVDAIKIDSNQKVTTTGVIQGATSLWYRATHIPAFAMSPGGSGATFTAPDGNTLGGMILSAAGHYLYSGDSITSMWDGASDLSLRVTWEVNVDNTAGADADTVDLQLICYYKGDAEITTKSQTVEVPVTVGKSARYKRFTTVFPIDWDLAGNIVENGDKIHFRINLETDTSEVNNIIVNTLMFRYQTAKVNPEV